MVYNDQLISAIKRFGPFEDTYMCILFRNNIERLEKENVEIKKYGSGKKLKSKMNFPVSVLFKKVYWNNH